MAYSILNNTPSAGNIQWSGVHMQYNGVSYTITNGYTNYKYIYWLASNPTVFYVSDTFPTLGVSDALVFLNKGGIAMVVPGATVLDGGLIVPGSIYAVAIAANTISGDKLLVDSITTREIAAGAITAGNIAANAVTAGTVAANAIGASAIAANVITGDKLVADAITAREIAANTITANEMVAGTITAASGIIADAAITNAKIASLSAAKITTGTLTSVDGKTYFNLDTAEIRQAATVGGVALNIRLNPTEGLAFYSGATKLGGLAVVDGELGLTIDTISSQGYPDHFIRYYPDVGSGTTTSWTGPNNNWMDPFNVRYLSINGFIDGLVPLNQVLINASPIGESGLISAYAADLTIGVNAFSVAHDRAARVVMHGNDVNNPASVTLIASGETAFDYSALMVTPSTVTINGSTVWHGGNDGAGSGLDADKLGGAYPSVSPTYSSIVKRTTVGYIEAVFFKTAHNNNSNPASGYFFEWSNDGYIRSKPIADVKTELVTEASVVSALTDKMGDSTAAFPVLLGQHLSANSGVNSSYWLKIATITFTYRYGGSSAIISVLGNTSTTGAAYSGEIEIVAIQQAALGSAPFGRVSISNGINMPTTAVKAIITQNTVSVTVIELYVLSMNTYRNISTRVINYTGPQFINMEMGEWQANLPAGTQFTTY